jgi:alkyl hydroperoxide reductase subunit AhpC
MEKKIEENGIGQINCPMISDMTRVLSSQFNL